MKRILNLWSLNKQNQWILKLGISVLVVGLAFHLLFNQSARFEPELEDAASSYIAASRTADVSISPSAATASPETSNPPPEFVSDDIPMPPPAPQPSSAAPAVTEGSNSTIAVDGRPDPDENEAPDDGNISYFGCFQWYFLNVVLMLMHSRRVWKLEHVGGLKD
ncbi:hypothetical protein LINGRAHAP2_LOCUS3063 [Linum grandiflorum]